MASYVRCPSFKEEFGIAILEAMAAGFVAIAPKRGEKSYRRDGYNGFLIDTTDEVSIEKELRRLLIDVKTLCQKNEDDCREWEQKPSLQKVLHFHCCKASFHLYIL